MEAKWRGRIISALRRLTFSYPPRNVAKAKQKIGPAIYTCIKCNTCIYEGTSNKNFEKLKIDYPGLIKGKLHMDHLDPCIPLAGFKSDYFDWTTFINNMFCEESNFQGICSSCHKDKTDKEKKRRSEYKKNKKKT